MGTYSKIILSGSTDGEGIKVTGTAPSLGTVIHTAVTGAAQSVDEVWIWAYGAVTTPVELSIAFGVTTATGSRLTHTITASPLGGAHLIVPGWPLKNAKVVKAKVTADAQANIFGYVNRFAS
jgi:hypothetical protein